MHTLILTLGSGQRNQRGGPSGYRTACYRFPDEVVSEPTQLFGLALFEWMRQHKSNPPDRLLLLGTSGSIWGAFYEYLCDREVTLEGVDLETCALELDEKTQQQTVADTHLPQVASHLAAGLGLRPEQIDCRLIPTAATETEQQAILGIIAEAIPAEGVVDFDMTHGLRHLPVLELVSALHLASSKKNVSIGSLYYGALELADRSVQPLVAPVVLLDRVTRLLEWRDGVRDFERNGDVGVLCKLLGSEGEADVKLRDSLRETQFFFETNQTHRAGAAAQQAERLLRTKEAPIAPEGQLFREMLYRSVQWAERWNEKIAHNCPERNHNFARAQLQMAELAFKQQRYQRCIVLLLEACESSRLEAHERWDGYNQRQEAGDRLLASLRPDDKKQLKRLRHLRNQLAHTVTGQNSDILNAVMSEARLRKLLMDAENGLIPWVRRIIMEVGY